MAKRNIPKAAKKQNKQHKIKKIDTSTGFNLLADEIKCKIWDYCLPPDGALELQPHPLDPRKASFVHHGKVPITLAICHQSREQALKYYRFQRVERQEELRENEVEPGRTTLFHYFERIIDNPRLFNFANHTITVRAFDLQKYFIACEDTMSNSDEFHPAGKHFFSDMMKDLRQLAITTRLDTKVGMHVEIISRFQNLKKLWLNDETSGLEEYHSSVSQKLLDELLERMPRQLPLVVDDIYKMWAKEYMSAKRLEMTSESKSSTDDLEEQLRKLGVPLPDLDAISQKELRTELGQPPIPDVLGRKCPQGSIGLYTVTGEKIRLRGIHTEVMLRERADLCIENSEHTEYVYPRGFFDMADGNSNKPFVLDSNLLDKINHGYYLE